MACAKQTTTDATETVKLTTHMSLINLGKQIANKERIEKVEIEKQEQIMKEKELN